VNDLATLESDGLRISPETPTDEIARILNTLGAMKERIKEVEKLIEAQLVERINQAGPFVLGTVRYYVGKKKTTKCVNVPGALEAVLLAVGGDWEKFTEFLSSQPVKYGAAKGILDAETWGTLFKVEEEDELKEGSAARLMKTDTKFLKGGC
jgi:hypothetical protein